MYHMWNKKHKKHRNTKTRCLPLNIYNPYKKKKKKKKQSQNKQNTYQKLLDPIYNLPLSPYVCTPIFCDELLKGNHDSSEGGACGVEPLACTKSACKAAISLSTSNRICPCAA